MNAELILTNGNIFTMDESKPKVEAMVVSDGKIIYTGDNEGAHKYASADTIIEDLDGSTILPGFIETHVHVPGNAYNVLFNIDLYDAKTVEELNKTIKDFVDAHPERNDYYGRGYELGIFPGEESQKGPKKERLDAVCPDKPMVLTDSGGHIYWLNSKAFEVFGIDKNTPDVPGGVIEKDENGELWGILKEEAKYLFKEASFTQEQKIEAFNNMQDLLLSCGITSIGAMRQAGSQDPIPILETMEKVREQGDLKLRISAAVEIKNDDIPSQLKNLQKLMDRYDYDDLNVGTAKFFIDGTVEGVTAYLKEPYLPAAGMGDSFRGEPLWELDKLTETMIAVLKMGLNIHIHAIGDGAVKMSVDALEKAQKDVDKDHRNCITHLQIVDPDEIGRMSDNNIIACVNPLWHMKSPSLYYEAELPFLGKERAEKEYPLKSFVDKGVMITCSADHPVSPDPNPMYGIECSMTRNAYVAKDSDVEKLKDMDDPTCLLNRNERLPLKEMLKGYTVNGAYYLYKENQIGSLEPGKYADYIVLDKNIFETDPLDIEDIRVIKTVLEGKTVFTI